MSTDSSNEKSYCKLPTFDGQQKNFQVWWIRFGAFATVNNFWQALDENGDENLPSSDRAVIDAKTPEGSYRCAMPTRKRGREDWPN